MAINTGYQKCQIHIGNTKVLRAYLGSTKIYSSGNTVTYCTDTGTTYAEEAEEGASCLSPKTFTPAKSGWEFVGWRQDTAAGGSVLSSLSMGDAPVTLYAVFRQTVTVTYYNGSTSASSTSKYRYYNNGNVFNPSFTLTQTALSGWTARGWSGSSHAAGDIAYSNGGTYSFASNATLFGMYYKTITVTYYNSSTSASSTSGTRYYNSGSGAILNPSFTLTQAALSGWTARGWSTGTAGNAGITYSNGAAFTRDSNITLYGMYYQTITLSYSGNGAASGSTAAQTGTRYYNSNGNIVNPSFALAANGFGKTGYSFSKWALGSTSGTQYSAGTSISLSGSTTAYALWTYVGAPFYVVAPEYQASLSLGWTFTSKSNLSRYESTFTAGKTAPHLQGQPANDAQSAGFTAVSDAIATNGNKSIRIWANFSNGGCNVTINGVTQSLEFNKYFIWDISNTSSITISVTASLWPYSGDVYFQPKEIYLY